MMLHSSPNFEFTVLLAVAEIPFFIGEWGKPAERAPCLTSKYK